MSLKDREARLAYGRAHYAANRDRVMAAANQHYAENGDAIRARRAIWRTPEVRAANAEIERQRYRALRCEMLAAYGGRCACCGETEAVFLELDHANDDGAAQRREIGRGSKRTYTRLKKQGWPKEGYRLLCANCNQGRARNGGTCPHEIARKSNG